MTGEEVRTTHDDGLEVMTQNDGLERTMDFCSLSLNGISVN